MTNGERAPLHELYNRVCAKRPEATVTQDAMKLIYLPFSKSWEWAGNGLIISLAFNERTASALILRHWLSLVQNYDDLCHPNGKWRMFDGVGVRTYPCADTPLEAIAAYLEAQP